jgi:hypothetical protein
MKNDKRLLVSFQEDRYSRSVEGSNRGLALTTSAMYEDIQVLLQDAYSHQSIVTIRYARKRNDMLALPGAQEEWLSLGQLTPLDLSSP